MFCTEITVKYAVVFVISYTSVEDTIKNVHVDLLVTQYCLIRLWFRSCLEYPVHLRNK